MSLFSLSIFSGVNDVFVWFVRQLTSDSENTGKESCALKRFLFLDRVIDRALYNNIQSRDVFSVVFTSAVRVRQQLRHRDDGRILSNEDCPPPPFLLLLFRQTKQN